MTILRVLTVPPLVRVCVQAVISEAAKLDGAEGDEERFIDPRSKTSYVFDHLGLVRF
jgi:hypothetical protein